MDMRMSSFDYDVKKKPSKNTQIVKYHTVENPLATVKNNADQSINNETESIDSNINVMGVNMDTKVTADDESVTMNLNVGGVNMGADVKVTSQTRTQIKTTQEYESNQINVQNNNSSTVKTSDKNCTVAMSNSSFLAATNSIKKQSFADTKMKTAQQVLRSNCMSTTQIVEVMKLFSFEESKLEFAKAAYKKCVDKEQYFVVNDAFTFSSSVDELTEFIEENEE
jgi:hypothetical protein